MEIYFPGIAGRMSIENLPRNTYEVKYKRVEIKIHIFHKLKCTKIIKMEGGDGGGGDEQVKNRNADRQIGD